MMWKRDPEVQASEKLPDWPRFHRCCGEQRLFFDHIDRHGRGYKCVAFTTEPTKAGGWRAVHLADGTGKSVLDALGDALAGSGCQIAEAEQLLARGLAGDPEKFIALPTPLTNPAAFDDFDALIAATDDFDGLL